MNIDLTMEAMILAVGLFIAAEALDININVNVYGDGKPATAVQEVTE